MNDDFERLKEIKSGKVYKDVDKNTGNVVGYRQAGFCEEINAIRARQAIAQQISKMQGWDAPTKTAQTDSKGNDIKHITPEEAAKFIKEMTKDYSKE